MTIRRVRIHLSNPNAVDINYGYAEKHYPLDQLKNGTIASLQQFLWFIRPCGSVVNQYKILITEQYEFTDHAVIT